jgi:outer membrane protein OmpA-like peptidoglycan-associated protein
MTLQPELRTLLARIATVVVMAAGTGACSSVPSWVDPTSWFGGGGQDTSPDSESDNAQTPDLASIPNKPAPPSTSDEQKQISDSLAADRSSAQYSAEALRGGTESGAAPPPAAPEQAASNASEASSTAQAESEKAAAAPSDQGSVPAPAPTAGTSAAAPAPQPAAEVASTEAAPPVTATAPAVSTTAPPAPAPQVVPASNTQLGFEPSKAPPLDPSVSRYVPRAILDKVQQSNTPAAVPSSNQSSANDRFFLKAPSTDNQRADVSARSAAAARHAASATMRGIMPVSYSPGEQVRLLATVFFRHDEAELTDQDKAAIRLAVQIFDATGGTGFIRVVGHSSSRTPNLPAARRLEVIFERSQDYAAAVAQELIRDGVLAEKVLIESVGNSEPVSYPSTRNGDTSNRRAEIFM